MRVLGLFSGLLLTAVTAAAQSPGGDAMAGGRAEAMQVRREVSFLGFSRDESVSAWSVRVVRQHGSRGTQNPCADSYELFQLVDSVTQEVLAAYRGGPIVRRCDGRVTRTAASTLATANPTWNDAQPKRRWLRFRRQHRFDGPVLSQRDSTVRLLLDEDVTMDVAVSDETLDVTGQPGQGVGFRLIARLLNGQHVSLGHYRWEGADATVWRAAVKVYHSRTARHVAVVADFSTDERPDAPYSLASVGRLPEAPLGTNAVGTWELTQQMVRRGGEDFADVFRGPDPKVVGLFDFFVGREW